VYTKKIHLKIIGVGANMSASSTTTSTTVVSHLSREERKRRWQKPNAGVQHEKTCDPIAWDRAHTKGACDSFLIGIDEAGRGPLAGPVVCTACVFLDPRPILDTKYIVRDSKSMTPRQLKKTESFLRSLSSDVMRSATVLALPDYIDEHGILKATMDAMKRCAQTLMADSPLDTGQRVVIIDGNYRPEWAVDDSTTEYKAVLRADYGSITVAAASILAKTTRDAIMCQIYERAFPGYKFTNHKGYGTSLHSDAIKRNGAMPHCHRRLFVRKLVSDAVQEDTSERKEKNEEIMQALRHQWPEVEVLQQ
jgi:ribonuclease HII